MSNLLIQAKKLATVVVAASFISACTSKNNNAKPAAAKPAPAAAQASTQANGHTNAVGVNASSPAPKNLEELRFFKNGKADKSLMTFKSYLEKKANLSSVLTQLFSGNYAEHQLKMVQLRTVVAEINSAGLYANYKDQIDALSAGIDHAYKVISKTTHAAVIVAPIFAGAVIGGYLSPQTAKRVTQLIEDAGAGIANKVKSSWKYFTSIASSSESITVGDEAADEAVTVLNGEAVSGAAPVAPSATLNGEVAEAVNAGATEIKPRPVYGPSFAIFKSRKIGSVLNDETSRSLAENLMESISGRKLVSADPANNLFDVLNGEFVDASNNGSWRTVVGSTVEPEFFPTRFRGVSYYFQTAEERKPTLFVKIARVYENGPRRKGLEILAITAKDGGDVAPLSELVQAIHEDATEAVSLVTADGQILDTGMVSSQLPQDAGDTALSEAMPWNNTTAVAGGTIGLLGGVGLDSTRLIRVPGDDGPAALSAAIKSKDAMKK